MDPIVMAAGTALVQSMATSAWEGARSAVVALWRRAHPGTADEAGEQVSRQLETVRAQVLRGDADVTQALAGAWRLELDQLVAADPALLAEIRRLLDEHLLPALAEREQAGVQTIIQNATVSGGVNIQAGRDFHGPVPPAS